MTVVDWVDIFTRKEIKNIVIDSLRYCQKNKGLTILGWCLMPSHLHAIFQAALNAVSLSDILRDMKTFTSKEIVKFIKDGNESRKEWLLELFSRACNHLSKKQEYKIWQDGNQPKIIYSPHFFGKS